MNKLYYTPPTDEVFNELVSAATLIWSKYDDTYGYATSKINRIKDLENIEDNFMYIFAMFDQENQRKIFQTVSPECIEALKERMLDGGMDREELNYLLS